ncbi:hypothetical protein [Paraburkholderia phytofirmans]|uniref:Uncharacterized protein n=1 Tax=Paraburkholderia phytofirmans (strain DSM 17436 / LMG 22146 / PsJN) TaxID=398527 RepID=B2T270_PARPJ|nr:hypothetical protein [Paraburkholderia phytofirmans]ACD15681.1 hypothetical protein Bphyt_1266 [Paraburkholderia phytofirmans PsJN]
MMFRALAATSAVILLAMPSVHALQAAPLELASIPVSLTVQEACLVQSADALISTANQPEVSCIHGAPFQITQAGFDPGTPADTARNATQPVEFVATHDTQHTVWTVNF